MPFKLKLKKTRQYSVVSKTLFIITIELLDGSNVECTLSSESPGKECFDHVCQKALINQPEFFGLRYITKDKCSKWVDLDLPLKKQLDKYASSTTLYLRVMYYVTSGVSLITDEMTRYHYFLHLKNDVVEGRIMCDFNEAVLLASYSRQAEYCNHGHDANNAEHFKRLLSFPSHLIENGQLEAMIEAVVQQVSALQNMSQASAEEYYIVTCQQLDGYGQEMFTAKDDNHKEVILGVSVLGVVVNNVSLQTIKWFRWTDINNVINNKRLFSIECSEQQKIMTFQLRDAESAKYVWKLCVLQHTFYMQFEQHGQFKSPDNITNAMANFVEERIRPDIREMVDSSDLSRGACSESLNTKSQSASCLNLSVNQEMDLTREHVPQHQLQSVSTMAESVVQYGSQPEIHIHNSETSAKPNFVSPISANYCSPSQRYPDVTHLYENQIDINAVGTKKVSWRNQLDEKACLNSLNFNEAKLHQNKTSSNACFDNVVRGVNLLHLYKPPPPYPTSGLCSNSTPDLASQRMTAPLQTFASHVSGSSPDLGSTRLVLNHQRNLNSRHSISNQYLQKLSYFPSTQINYENISAFPDDVNMHEKHYVDDSSITKHIQKIYDDRGNVIYCMPRNIEQIVESQIKNVKINASVNFVGGNVYNQQNSNAQGEPIYENVPLPWQNENVEIRKRTHSIHSAPGLTRFADNNVSVSEQKETTAMVQSQPLNLINPTICESTLVKNDLKHVYNDIEVIPQPSSGNIGDLFFPEHTFNKPQYKYTENVSALNLRDMNYAASEDFPVSMKTNVTRLNKIQSLIELPITQNYNFKVTKAESFNNNTMLPRSTENITINNKIVIMDKNNILNRSTSHVEYSNSDIFKRQTFQQSHGSSYYEDTTSTNVTANSTKEKKKRKWGLLGIRAKSTDKVKCATLGREKNRTKQSSEEMHSRHRWSTGLPRSHPLPSTISKEALCELLEKKLADGSLLYEFEYIPKRQGANDTSVSDNVFRNRVDYKPCEENRVRITPTKENRTGFIKATQVTASVGTQQLFYICAESPSQQTISYFLQCVWEAGVYLVVQLRDSEKFRYLPSSSERCQEYGQYAVWREYSQDNGQCITSKLRLYQLCSRSYRSVWHLQYEKWSQEDCPRDVGHFLGFLEEMCSVRQHSILEVPIGHNRNPPILIHCPTGGIRSGLTIASHLLLHTLDYNQELDIPRVIGQLRQQQENILITLVQYKFLYKVIIHYLHQTRLI